MSDTEKGYIPRTPNGTTEFPALDLGDRECPVERCNEERYMALGMEFHVLRDHHREGDAP